jgi:hypothetical protein
VKASLPRIIRCLLVGLVSCSAAAQEKHTAPPQSQKPETVVTVAGISPVADAASVNPAPQGVLPLNPPDENQVGVVPIPLWRGEGSAIPIPPAGGNYMPVPAHSLRLIEINGPTQVTVGTSPPSPSGTPKPEKK